MKTTRSLSLPAAASAGARHLTRRERHSAAVRQRLFDAAMRLFAQRGFQNITVEEITQAADVGKGTFFNYFPSKEELLTSFGEIRLGKIRNALHAAREGREPIHSILRRLQLSLSEDPGRSPELGRSIMLTLLSSDVVRAQSCPRMRQAQLMFGEIFTLGRERGEIRRDIPAVDLARLFWESHFGSFLLWALDPAGSLASALLRSFERFWASAAAQPRSRAKKGNRS
jgi:AcrR family transcriptional regulator